jgi:hypothetical protein
MWGRVKNPGSRRTTNSFTRNQGMTENEPWTRKPNKG